MGFTGIKGKKLTEKDTQQMKAMFNGTLDGIRDTLDFLHNDRYCRSQNFYPPIIAEFQKCAADFEKAFTEAADSGRNVDFRDFFHEQMEQLGDRLREQANIKSREYDNFKDYIRNPFVKKFEGEPELKDTQKGLHRSFSGFKLASKPMEGIEEFAEFDPATADSSFLNTLRAGNSGTLRAGKSNPASEDSRKAFTGYYRALDLTKAKAVELREKPTVSFGDLFETFASINRTLRTDDKRGGMLRYEFIRADRLVGVDGLTVPEHLIETLDKIAVHMNEIKQVRDPRLQKTQAIQLAAFIYQTTLSEHVFDDGNGRSCRLFADTILQTFGLPPHTPNAGEITAVATIGKELDFERGAKLFFEGVKKSDEFLKVSRSVAPEQYKDLAARYLKREAMDPGLTEVLGSEGALALAANVNDTKHCMIESICSLIQANHLFARDSDEYKDLVSTSVRFAETLYSNPLNSTVCRAVLDEMDASLNRYDKHCEKEPKGGSTRKARMKASFEMKDLVYHLKTQAKKISAAERVPYTEKAAKLLEDCMTGFPNEESQKDCAARYIYVSGIMADMRSEWPGIPASKLEQLLSEEGVKEGARQIAEGGHLEESLEKALEKSEEKSVKQILEDALDAHKDILRAEKKAEKAALTRSERGTDPKLPERPLPVKGL